MANIFDVAKYILEQKGEMSTMKLQKLCYYCQAWHLVWADKPLFKEEFEAWVNGPVCRELYLKTKGQFSAIAEDETGGENNLTDEQKIMIDKIIEFYGPYDAQWLSDLTHDEIPWNQARGDIPRGMPCTNIITKESMGFYYGGL